jgi:hypothetical protein
VSLSDALRTIGEELAALGRPDNEAARGEFFSQAAAGKFALYWCLFSGEELIRLARRDLAHADPLDSEWQIVGDRRTVTAETGFRLDFDVFPDVMYWVRDGCRWLDEQPERGPARLVDPDDGSVWLLSDGHESGRGGCRMPDQSELRVGLLAQTATARPQRRLPPAEVLLHEWTSAGGEDGRATAKMAKKYGVSTGRVRAVIREAKDMKKEGAVLKEESTGHTPLSPFPTAQTTSKSCNR